MEKQKQKLFSQKDVRHNECPRRSSPAHKMGKIEVRKTVRGKEEKGRVHRVRTELHLTGDQIQSLYRDVRHRSETSGSARAYHWLGLLVRHDFESITGLIKCKCTSTHCVV
jgi:hypothetical protein